MAPKSSRQGNFALPARRRAAKSFRPRIESLEDRTAPALFSPQTPVNVTGLTNANFGCLATGDFNNDGKTDMVLTNYGTAGPGNNAGGNTISILLGNGSGGFGSATNLTLGSNKYVSYVAVGDLNGDNKQDLAVVNTNEDSTGSLRIYLGNGNGGFTLSSQGAMSTGSSNACWVGIAQVTNGDSNPDVVVCGFGNSDQGQTTIFGNNITVFQGDGTGAVNLITTLENGLAFIPTSLALADFNNDGTMDIAATVPGVPPDVNEPQPEGIIQMFSGNGTGGFDIGPSFGSGGALPINIQVANLNADNLPDLVIANAGDPDGANGYQNFGSNSAVGVAINGGGMNFNTNSLTAGIGGGGAKSVFAVTVADFDMDGKKDIAGILYGDPLTGSTARVLEYKGDGTGGFVGDANSPFSGLAPGGQYLAAVPLDANATPDVVFSTDAGKYGSLLNTTVTGPTVTINQAGGQADPTNASPISYAVHFSEAVNGFDGSDISFAGSTVGGALQAAVSGSGQDYSVTVTGMTGTGTVRASIPAGAANAVAGGGASTASTSADNTVTFDGVAPTVTINQAAGQADPTNTGPIAFTVVFSENVSGFTAGDVDLSGSSLTGLTASVTGSGSSYTVSVTGMSTDGTVVASIPAGAATDAVGNASAASTSTDNTVTFALPAPAVTINQAAGQADPTNTGPITFTVHFSESVTGFDGSDIDFVGSTVGGTLAAGVSGAGQDYTVTVAGMTGTGTVVASVKPGAAVNGSGTPSGGSTSTDNTVTFDGTAPTVTINQAVGQSDPSSVASIKFDVKFSEPVTGFNPADVSLAGSTVAGTLAIDVTGSLDTYTVTVTGMTSDGVVVATIPAGAATDAAGNANLASTSTDNSVTYVTNGTLGFSQAVFNASEDDPSHSVTITVTRTGSTGGPVSINYATSDGTAHSIPVAGMVGQTDYTPTSGTLNWGDGEGGAKTFTIPITNDTANEGRELINLTLSNPTGGAGLGATSAVVAIAPSDGKLIDGTVKLPASVFADGTGLGGDLVTVRLGGKVGTATVYMTDPLGHGYGPIEWINLAGTDPARSTLTISVKKPRGGFSDGRAKLAEVTGTGLKALTAPTTDLDGPGINLSGFLRTLRIGNISGGADITMAAPPVTLLRPAARITAGTIGDGTTITVVGSPLASLTAISVGDGSITAPSVGTITAMGKARTSLAAAIPGDFKSDVIVSGAGVLPTKLAMTRLRAAGSVTGATINVGGSVGTISVGGRGVGDFTGSITVGGNLNAVRVAGKISQTVIDVTGNVKMVSVGSFWNSRLDAGYTGPDDGSGTYDTPSTIGTFRVTSKIDGFQSSNVIATFINSVTLASVNPDNTVNPGTHFGFTADRAVKYLVVTSPTETFKFNPLAPSPQTTPALGDFWVVDRDGP